jgi:hypothetical protein
MWWRNASLENEFGEGFFFTKARPLKPQEHRSLEAYCAVVKAYIRLYNYGRTDYGRPVLTL